MKEMTVGEFKAQFSSALEMVLQGEEILILYGRSRKPVAIFKPIEETVKYLIGTDTFLLLLMKPKEISKKILEIVNNKNNIYISSITFWEIATKVQTQTLDLGTINILHLPNIAEQYNLKIITPEPYDYVNSTQFQQPPNPDTLYDQIIVQQAIRNNLVLISKDEKFRQYEENGLQLMWD